MTDNEIIHSLLSEKYYELQLQPNTRDEQVFMQIERLYHKYRRLIDNNYTSSSYVKLNERPYPLHPQEDN